MLDHCCQKIVSEPLLPSALLLASFLGSGHCVAMCGGLVTAVSKTKWHVMSYHLGRLASYLLIGALFGMIGSKVKTLPQGLTSWIVAFGIGGSFIFLGFYNLKQEDLHIPLPGKIDNGVKKMYAYLIKGLDSPNGGIYPATIGALSIFLPCGWLYGFALASITTQSPLYGAMIMFLFWLGTVPALSFAPLLFRKLLSPMAKYTPKLFSLVLILVGFLSIGMKLWK